MDKTRIAVVSTNAICVDEHFGKAKRFLIYDLKDNMEFIEERNTETLSVNDPKHEFDPDKFNLISSVIADCNKIYMTRIGEVPAAKLRKQGIEPVIFDGEIKEIPHQ
ncbi:MAG: hypothetical protein KKC46_13555 [Proteobacteria bacterium]|nr:hypothetical protein [Pseudomonadota bacterium]